MQTADIIVKDQDGLGGIPVLWVRAYLFAQSSACKKGQEPTDLEKLDPTLSVIDIYRRTFPVKKRLAQESAEQSLIEGCSRFAL